MLRHVVLFRWNDDVSDDTIAAVEAGLSELPGAIDTIRAYRFGRDLGLAEPNWDFTVTADFDDEAGYVVYRDDAQHQALIASQILPIVAERAAVQFSFDA